jgi:hypothetical protein
MGVPKDYDRELQMFRRSGVTPDLTKLTWLRWLTEQGKLEHAPMGESVPLPDPEVWLAEEAKAAEKVKVECGCVANKHDDHYHFEPACQTGQMLIVSLNNLTEFARMTHDQSFLDMAHIAYGKACEHFNAPNTVGE